MAPINTGYTLDGIFRWRKEKNKMNVDATKTPAMAST
jgi:hypothetical protein